MPSQVMTYSSLLTDVMTYCERVADSEIQDQFPRLLMLAENQIATDAKMLGTQQVANNTFTTGVSVLTKPQFWRKSTSFQFLDVGSGDWKNVFLRSVEFLNTCFPTPGVVGNPLYYADYDYTHFLVLPAPSSDMDFRIIYDAKLEPLSEESEVNWTTENAPQLLLTAVMVEAQRWLKNYDKLEVWTSQYAQALSSLKGEDAKRSVDRNERRS